MLMRRSLIALVAAGMFAGMTGTAQANLDDESACQQADERSGFNATEERYLSNPYRGTPNAQASWLMASWGVDTSDPFPRTITIYAKGPYTANCVIDYAKVGGFGVTWHVVLEVRLYGDARVVNTFWNTARNCYGTSGGTLYAPPANCEPYGATDGNTAID